MSSPKEIIARALKEREKMIGYDWLEDALAILSALEREGYAVGIPVQSSQEICETPAYPIVEMSNSIKTGTGRTAPTYGSSPEKQKEER